VNSFALHNLMPKLIGHNAPLETPDRNNPIVS
jgi:hypothetical protein